MKKVSLYVFLVLMICNIAPSQSSLSECEGNDKNISSFSAGHFNKIRKWTNCQGTAVGPNDGKYVGEFYKGKFHGHGTYTHAGRKYVGQYQDHKRHGQGTYTYAKIGRAHVWTPVTSLSRMPSSAWKKKQKHKQKK